MNPPNIPYRITIELAIGEKGKTITITGETPDLRASRGTSPDPDAVLCAIAANALLWESNALSHAASSHAAWKKMIDLLNVPIPQHRM